MQSNQILAYYDQIVIRKEGDDFYASLETVKPPNLKHAVLAIGEGKMPQHALEDLFTHEILRCPECENRMEWANRQVRDGIEFLPQCPVCKLIGGIKLQEEGVTA